jgi:uncharacterized protein
MSMSLRDQLLQAGLISKKQASEAERHRRHQERQQPSKDKHSKDKHSREGHAGGERALAPQAAQAAKIARDQALSRQQHEKAERKARSAQIKQLIDQNRLPPVEGGESYNFVDGTKIRRIGANASIRDRITRGEVAIVRHEGRYDLVPVAIATRIRERDERAFIALGSGSGSSAAADAYREFSVPDDLMW